MNEFEKLCEEISQLVHDAAAHAESGNWKSAMNRMQAARYLSGDAEKLAKAQARKSRATQPPAPAQTVRSLQIEWDEVDTP